MRFGTTSDDISFGLTIDSNENIFVGGYTKGSLFGSNQGDQDIFLAKINPSNFSEISGYQDGTQNDDNIFTLSSYEDNIIFSGISDNSLFSESYGLYDGIVGVMNAVSLNVTNQIQNGTNRFDAFISSSIDSSNNIWIGGITSGDWFTENQGIYDLIVLKFNKNLELVFGVQYGGNDVDTISRILIDPLDDLWIGGYSSSSTLFDPNQGEFDSFIWKISGTDGNTMSAKQSELSNKYLDVFQSFSIKSDGSLIFGGFTNSTIFNAPIMASVDLFIGEFGCGPDYVIYQGECVEGSSSPTFFPTFNPTGEIIIYNNITHSLGAWLTVAYEPDDLGFDLSNSSQFGSSIISSSQQLLISTPQAQNGSEKGRVGIVSDPSNILSSFQDVDNFLSPKGFDISSLDWILSFNSQSLLFFSSNQSLMMSEMDGNQIQNTTQLLSLPSVVGFGDPLKILSSNESGNEVILLVGSQEVLYEVDVTVSSPPTSSISSSLNFSFEFGSSCLPGRSDFTSISLGEDLDGNGISNVVVGLPYCGENGGLVMLNGDDEENPFSGFKLIFPFDEEDVWRASPTLSDVSIPYFPQSVRYFGYRVVPSPDFNQDGQDDFWVVSFVNESWMNDSSPSYPIHEGERDVVVWLISLISSPQVEDGVFIKDVMYSNLTFQPFPSSHPRRTFGESISSTDDGLMMGAPDVGGSSEGWVYDIQINLPPDFESFPSGLSQDPVVGSPIVGETQTQVIPSSSSSSQLAVASHTWKVSER